DGGGDRRLAIWRQRVEVEALELVLGGDDTSALAEQRDEDRQQSVDVVKAVGGLAALEGEQGAEGDLDDDRHLGEAEDVPEADRRPAQGPGGTAPDAGGEIGGEDRDAGDQVEDEHRGGVDTRETVACMAGRVRPGVDLAAAGHCPEGSACFRAIYR